MDRLANILAFVTVVETGSFTDSASRLRLATSVVSKRIKDLEEYLGTTLLLRTTRRLELTPAGHAYAGHARKMLDELAEVEENLRHRNENPVGDIRLAAPASFGNQFLGDPLASFLEKYPDVTVTLTVNDRAAEEFDLAIRIGAGSVPEEDGLVTQKLAQSRRVVVAAKEYLERQGRPKIPEDLARHNCLRHSGVADGKSWLFRQNGNLFRQHVGGRFAADSGALLCEAAVRGCGIAALPTYLAGRRIVSGELEILLEDFEPEPEDIFVVYKPGHRLRATTQKLVEHLAAYLAG